MVLAVQTIENLKSIKKIVKKVSLGLVFWQNKIRIVKDNHHLVGIWQTTHCLSHQHQSLMSRTERTKDDNILQPYFLVI